MLSQENRTRHIQEPEAFPVLLANGPHQHVLALWMRVAGKP